LSIGEDMVRNSVVLAIAVICLLIGAGIGYAVKKPAPTPATPTPTPSPTPAPPRLSGTLKIGGLIELTGDLGPWGPMYKAALELAESDINSWLKEIGADFTIDVVIEDVASDPDVTLEKMKSLHAAGVLFFVGPTSSAELSAIKEYADANQLLVISHSSTAVSLSIEDDFIFRTCPNDFAQGPAIARMIYDTGVEHIIILFRQDDWGVGLKDAVVNAFEKLGGDVYETIPYVEKAEYSAEIATLNDKVSSAVSAYGADKVGTLAISFGEIASIVEAAKEYPVLREVNWYGCDGFVMATELLDPSVVDFVLDTGMVTTVFAPSKTPKFNHVREYIYSQVGEEPDAYAYPLYDSVWLIVHGIMHVGAYDPVAVKAVLPKIAENYFGATGWMRMTSAGDKEASDYDLCAVVEVSEGNYEWQYIGKWVYATDTIIWTRPIYG